MSSCSFGRGTLMLEAHQQFRHKPCDFADTYELEREVMNIARKLYAADALLGALKDYLEVRQEFGRSRSIDA